MCQEQLEHGPALPLPYDPADVGTAVQRGRFNQPNRQLFNDNDTVE